ncbi:MAG: hypothetical protein ACREPY_07470 [Rhodanobacteraceae bacterium]
MISANKLVCVASVLAVGLLAGMAQASEAVKLASASKLIERASYQAGASATPALAKIVQALTTQSGAQGNAVKYVDYYLGYANHALAEDYIGQDDHKAGDYLDKAEAALQRAIHADPDFAEAHALLASVYGLEIGMHPIKGMWLGSRLGKQMRRAGALAPRNPRVTLIRAISDAYTPSAFGGSKTRAMREFGMAIEQFATYQPSNALAPTWGRAGAHALRGDAEVAAGQTAAAVRDYQAALALAPDYAAVKKALAKLHAPASSPADSVTTDH